MEQKRIELLLVRHGKTKNNLEGRFCGRADYPLAEEGRQYIAGMVARWPYPAVEKLFCSPALRCRQTARLCFPGMEPEIMDGLQEIYFGEFEERLAGDLRDFPEYLEHWIRQTPEFSFPGGETMGDCRDRGAAAIRGIARRCVDEGWSRVAVVTHSMLISLTLKALLSEIPQEDMALFCPNAMGIGVYLAPDEIEQSRPLHFLGRLPQGAPLPDLKNNPYIIKGR